MVRQGFLGLIGFLFGLFVMSTALADPSFDCRKAISSIDRLICADPALARADQKMAWAYADALKFLPGRRISLLAGQRAWLAGRVTSDVTKQSYDSCFFASPATPTAEDRACLREVYNGRTAQLRDMALFYPSSALADHIDYAKVMTPGQSVSLGDSEARCAAGSLQVLFGSARDGLEEVHGRGHRNARWVDCPIGGGHQVRFKIGGEFPPQPYGQCGASPNQIFSVWRDRRKIVAARDAGEECFGWKLQSVTVTAAGLEICEAVDKPEWNTAPKRGTCVTSKETGVPDEAAFVDLAPDILLAEPSAELGALCGQLIDPKDLTNVAVPADIRQPAWVSAGPGRKDADFTNLGFNATSLAASVRPESATFDLFNSGRAIKVYHAEEQNHWFDGSVFATDRPGVLTTPFDAHDWKRSIRSGIYPFVYDHVTIFFANGRTYLLNRPTLRIAEAGVVRLEASGERVVVCTLKRQQEPF